jgi:hypothetical protein
MHKPFTSLALFGSVDVGGEEAQIGVWWWVWWCSVVVECCGVGDGSAGVGTVEYRRRKGSVIYGIIASQKFFRFESNYFLCSMAWLSVLAQNGIYFPRNGIVIPLNGISLPFRAQSARSPQQNGILQP